LSFSTVAHIIELVHSNQLIELITLCRHALGMQSKRIRDSFLTSSTFHAPGTKGQYARLERDEGDGAWCPSGYIQPDTIDQYLQIDLPEPNFITNVATQGRYARGLGREYTSSYMLNYSRDGETWFQWSNYQGVKKLQGNADTNTVKRQMLNPGVAAASHVRIIPVSTRTMSVCLRLELYGCHWASGLVSYDIPAPMDSIAGQTNTRNTKYSDDTYDGTISTNWFRNGLGQLTDGVIGGNDLSQVGWSRSKSNDVTMTFRFADVRNFTRMRNYPTQLKLYRLFTSVKVSFSLNGKTFPSTANARSLAYEVPKDAFDRTARFVDVPLRNSIARYVRASFRIGDEYLLVSEVEFDNTTYNFKHIVTLILTFPDVLPPSDAFRYPDEDVSNEPTVTPTVSNNLPVIIGSLLGVIGLLVFIVLGLCYRQHRLRKKMVRYLFIFYVGPENIYSRVGEDGTTPLRYSYSRTSDNCGRSDHMVTLEPISRQSSSTGAGVVCSHNILSCTREVTRLLNQPDVTMNTPNSSHYAESSIFLPSLEAQIGNTSCIHHIFQFADEMMSLMSLHGDKPPEFPREKLEVVEQLGEGQFGEVQLCELDEPVLVAVKVLRADATSNAKEDFLKEVRVMSQMQDPNIVHLIAVCTNDEPYAMITEYMENGDLNQYLRSCAVFSNEVLINMCVQIASGMRYLSSHKFVHRDLATRNCLVDSNHSIRIADFGMSRNMYQSDYYRIQGRAVLPIRWMSWECVLMGKFSSASDAWAFGVTLWEIFSFCKLQPHNSLTDQQVIENMHHVFKRTGEEVHLQRPKRCPATLFNLIRQCWKRQPEDRPTFEQLHGYL
uniref:Discoidin domain-containing receptor 2 n=1 Tax=Ciona intestinalis TaxID=7719 RepID=F6RMP9_CIOIN